MKKIFLSLLVVFMVLSLSVVLVKAEGETSVALTDGVQIRTDGNNGLRWEATVTNPAEEGQVYGFLFAQGELTAEQLNKDTEGVIAKEVEELKEDGTYHATMVKFPTSAAVQDISVRAYVKTGETYIYSENVVVRNLSEVALNAKNKAEEGEFIDDVVSNLSTNYMSVRVDANNNVFVNKPVYETNPSKLEAEFVKDWNKKFGTNETNVTIATFYNYGIEGYSSSSDTDPSVGKYFKFFRDTEYGLEAKWLWLLKYLAAVDNTVHVGYQAKAILNYDVETGTNNNTNKLYKNDHLTCALANFFNGEANKKGYTGLNFATPSRYATLADYNNVIYADDPYFVEIGDSYVLTKLTPANGYTFDGYKSTELYNDSYEVSNSSDILAPQYTAIKYNIKYYNGSTELTDLAGTYTVNDTVTLPTLNIDGYDFLGWYESADFSGEAVEEISAGTVGAKTYYAKLVEQTYCNVSVTYDTNGAYLPLSYDPNVKSIAQYSNICPDNTLYLCDTNVTSYSSLLYVYKLLLNYDIELNAYKVVAVDAATAKANDLNVTWTHALCNNNSDITSMATVGQYIIIEGTPALNDTNINYVIVNDAATYEYPTTYTTTLKDPCSLLTVSRTGYEFLGWKSSIDNQIYTTYPGYKTNPGAITYTAQWEDLSDQVQQVALTDADLAVLENESVTKVVGSTFTFGKYSVNGTVYTFGETAFTTIDAALVAATENDVIYVFAGTYTEELTISTAKVSIIGPNYNIHGSETRVDEAIVTALTTISADNTIINGLKFTTNGNIKVSANNTLISNVFMAPSKTIACNGQNRQGCIVDGANISDLIVANSYIAAPGTSNSYIYQFMSFNNVTNLTIKNNYICNPQQSTISSSYAGMRIYTMKGNFEFVSNTVAWGTDGYVFNLANASGASTINVIDNIFKDNGLITQTATLAIQSCPATAKINIIGNEFYSFKGSTFTLNNDKGSAVSIKYNYYDANTNFKLTTKGSAVVSYENNCYMTTLNASTTVTDYGVITSKEALDAAYAEYLSTLA